MAVIALLGCSPTSSETLLAGVGPGALTIAPLVLALAACSTTHSPTTSRTGATVVTSEARAIPNVGRERIPASAAQAKELPRGGRLLFPDHRLVGYCGTPGAPALGALQGNLDAKAKALEARAAPYADGREILPVFELIAVVVQGYPGADGKYRSRVEDRVVDDYLRAARQSKSLLLLNIQPGQSDFLTEVKSFEVYLREPDVGVALDPEWAMKAKQRPGASWGGNDRRRHQRRDERRRP